MISPSSARPATVPHTGSPSPTFRLPALASAVTVLVLGLIGLDTAQLWRDELATWSAARRSVAGLAGLAGNADAFYLPYYLLLHGWTSVFGDSAVSLRLPSLLACAGAAAAAAVLAGRWFGVRAAWCAGVLFALVPMVSRMAQEARPYGFVLLFTALATLALVHALDRPAWGRWGLYALALAAVGLTQLTGLALVAGHAVLVLLARGPGRWPFLPAAAASVLPSVPLAVISLGGSQGVVGFIPRPGFLDLLGVSAVVPPGSALWPQLLRSTTMAWVLLALALAALAVGPRRRVAGALAAFAGPVVAIWAASQAGPSFFFARYLVFLLPLLAVAAGVTVAALRLPAVIAAVLVVVAGASVPDQLATRAVASHEAAFYPYEMFSEHPGQYADYRGLAALLRQAQDGDAVVYSDRGNFWFTDTGVDYHLRGAGPRDVFLDRTPAQANALGAVEGTDHAARLADVRRVWVVGVGERQDPFAGSPALVVRPGEAGKVAAVTGAFRQAEVRWVPGFTVALMVR